MYKVFLTKHAEKSLAKLPKSYQLQFAKVLAKLARKPFSLDIKKMNLEHKITHRLRMGSYRIFIHINKDSKEIIVYDILRRTTNTYR